MNKYFKILLVFAWILVGLSCQKKDNTPGDRSKVTVTFTSPAPRQTYHKGDTVQVNTNVGYVSEILGIWVQIIDTATGEKLFEDNHDTHTDHFSFPTSWVDTLSDSATLQVKISVFVTNSATPAVRTTYFISKP